MEVGEAGISLSIFLHMGTLLAVIIAFREAVWGMFREFFLTIADIFTLKFSWKDCNDDRRMLFMVIVGTILLIPIILVKDFFTAPMSDGDIIFEGGAFIFTATLLFMADSCVKGIKSPKEMQLKDALIVGFFQIIALFPGVSRSGSTISAGLFCGLSRKTAVTFSFMLGIPAILGASILEIRELSESGGAGLSALTQDYNPLALAMGFVVAMLVGLFAIKLVKLLIKREKFKIFAIYTLTIGILCVIWGVFENITGTVIRI